MTEPAIICVLGMHRSGTSLVAQVLHALGLELGPEEHLMGPSEANPTGHWENEPISDLNDELLARLGGSWLAPPELSPGWERAPELADLRSRARTLVEDDFGDSDRWGFKDPRTCITLPFWQHILPPMRYVTCLRNPVDVAWSLQQRQAEPIPFESGVRLWLTYMWAALTATATQPTLIVSYEDFMEDPEPVVHRLAGFIESEEADAAGAYARAAIRVARRGVLWHHRTPLANVIEEPRLPFPVKALYVALRLLASGRRGVDAGALELLSGDAVESVRRQDDLQRRLAERIADLERVTKARYSEQQRRQRLEARLEASGPELEKAQAELAAIREEFKDAVDARVEERRRRQALEVELDATRAEVARLQADSRGQEPEPGKPKPQSDYDRLVDEVRARALELVPSGATVLVASKGDGRLLELDGRRGWHLPGGRDGHYLGYHPPGDTAVIAQLEALRARGADHLLLPAPALWWLEHYRGLRRHLDDRYTRIFRDERCAIYRLSGRGPAAVDGWTATLASALASVRIRSRRAPSVLDWGSGLGIGDQFPEVPVFVPPGDGDALPYLDRTFDIAVLASGDGGRLAEARRVASSAVITVDPTSLAAELDWLPDASSGWGEDVSVVLVPDAAEPRWDATITAFADTLDGGFAGELCVVGDPPVLGSEGDIISRVRLIRAGGSLAKRARAAAKASGRGLLVFATAPAVPLPGWLPSMLDLFARDEPAGVVGTRVLSPIGSLEEAGGMVAANGSLRRRGQGELDPDRPEYRFVKRVDFCSPPLVATTRDLFERLRGFDVEAAESVVDFSLRAGRAAAPVYYQPDARLVRI